MASILRDAFFEKGTHTISAITNGVASGIRPMVNGAILTGSVNLDNGMLVELDGRDAEGNKLCKPWEGTNQAYVIDNSVAEGLFTEYGEDDWTHYYVKVGEMCRLYKVQPGLRQDTNNFTVEPNKMGYDKDVYYDVTNRQFIVDGTASETVIKVGTVEEKETDLGFNAGTTTSFRIGY